MNSVNVVVIDDNQTGLDVMQELLSLVGANAITIQDPLLVEQMSYEVSTADIVFLDLEMPHIDGYDLLKILRNEIGVRGPVVAYSVHTSEVNVARDLGFDGFLGKPLALDSFPELFERILAGEQIWHLDA